MVMHEYISAVTPTALVRFTSISGVATDGLGGYEKGDYAMDKSGKDPGFVSSA